MCPHGHTMATCFLQEAAIVLHFKALAAAHGKSVTKILTEYTLLTEGNNSYRFKCDLPTFSVEIIRVNGNPAADIERQICKHGCY